MDEHIVAKELIRILAKYQEAAGRAVPAITLETRPAKDLEDFDSKEWPAVLALLEEELAILIPEDSEIFAKGKKARSVKDVVAVVCSVATVANAS